MHLEVIILAAGQGTRMCSSLPKVLHKLAGKPMLLHVAETAQNLAPEAIHIVVGYKRQMVEKAVSHLAVNCVYQTQQLGTGHAVSVVAPSIPDTAVTLLMYGDVPLIPGALVQAMADKATQGQLVLLTVDLKDPDGYGRIVRSESGQIVAIVEQKDTSLAQQAITEINTGIMALPATLLHKWLPRLQTNNAQQELYITDIVAMAVADGMVVAHMQPYHVEQTQGVNNQLQLATLERWWQQHQATQLLRQGIQIADPARFDLRGNLRTGSNVYIDINCVIEGQVTLGDSVIIGPNCHIKHAVIGARTNIKANSVIEDTKIAEDCEIGPFARLRPGTVIATKAKVGNFVEIKNTHMGENTKANHLTYLGDSHIGQYVNIGAGTITCNYDGVNKFQTYIEDHAFIGSNTALIAPVTIGTKATVGAGSTVTKNVPAGNLAVARGRQKHKADWATKLSKLNKG